MYERYCDILDLIYELQASTEGLIYADIQNKYGVSRRTAERMIKALRESFLDIEVLEQRPLRIRLRRALTTPKLNNDQITALQTATSMFEKEGMYQWAKELNELLKYLKADMAPSHLSGVDVDLEAWRAAEAFVFRPGPREQICEEVIQSLRTAILSFLSVQFDYTRRLESERTTELVHPYGFLHGPRQYLVAYNPAREDYRTYVLSRIEKLSILEKQYFTVDPAFNMQDYLADSFGTFKEKPVQVVWRFKSEYKEIVSNWMFHPTQRTRELRNGKIEVSFHSGGIQEMANHVITWGDAIEVIKPKRLINKLRAIKKTLP